MQPLPFQLNSAVIMALTLTCGGVCCGQISDSIRPGDGLGFRDGYAEAKRLFDESMYEEALVICDQTLEDIFPARVYSRLQAVATRCCLLLNRREDALRRIETIYQRDPESPHLSLIPLLWDDRLPASERYTARAEDLLSESPTRRLAAASSLLQESQHSEKCVQILTEVRASRRLPMSILAEIQLWRVQMPATDSVPLPTVRRWQKRAASLPESLRAGPQFIVGRALQLRHKPDQAALELLWLPLMQTDDSCLAASGLAEAVVCLEATGRIESARRLRRELQDRFGRTSAARRLTSSDSTLPRAVPFAE